MKKELIWFFGTSCTGKETLIRRLYTYKPRDLLCILGIENVNLEIFLNSNALGGREGIDINIFNLIQEKPEATLLIEGQHADFELRWVDKIQPSSYYRRIIFVHCDIHELHKRWITRTYSETEEQIMQKQQEQIDKIKEFSLPTICVDATRNYKKIDFPPNITR